MTALALIFAVVILALSLLHLLWAIGFWFPIRDETALARAVVGTPNVRRMPGAIPCAVVAVALMFVASLPFTPAFPGQILFLAGAAVVFGARGGLAYSRIWRDRLTEQPFADLDRRYYGPLCLAIGLVLMIFVVSGG